MGSLTPLVTHTDKTHCQNCVFWVRPDRTRSLGQCRRFAPRIMQGPHGDITSEHPVTEAYHWCGDAVPRPGTP